jgi:hypothetical protein
MARPRAADDFAAIRARMDELRRERQHPEAEDKAEPRQRNADRTRAARRQLDLLRYRWRL